MSAVALSCLTKRKIGEVFPFGILLETLLFYIFSYFSDLTTGFLLSLVLPLSGLVLGIIQSIRNKKEFFSLLFTRALLISLFFFVFVVIYHWGQVFSHVDEYAHWGLMVKESFRLKEFYCVPESLMYYNKEYPPFFSLLETFWCFVEGAYEERLCYMALNFTELTMFLPLIEKELVSCNWLKTATITVLAILLGYSVGFTPSIAYDTFFYNSIYIDWPIAYLIGFLFVYIIFSENGKSDYLFIGIGLSALILTKQISIAFCFLVVIYYLVFKAVRKEFNIRNIHFFILMISVPLLLLKSWNILIDTYELTLKFNASEISFFFPIDYFNGTLKDIEETTVLNFIDALFHNGVISWPIKISYASFMLIIPVGLALSGIKDNLKESVTTAIVYLAGGIGYAYAMLLCYVYLFGYIEGPGLVMFDRYMLTYVLAGFFMLFNIWSIKTIDSYRSLAILGIVICLMIRPGTIRTSVPQLTEKGPYDELIALLKEYDEVIGENEKVLVINQTNNEKQCAMRYAVPYNNGRYTYLDISYAGDEDYDNGEAIWENEFRKMLAEYDYLFLLDLDDTFRTYFWYGEGNPVTDCLYRIDYVWEEEIYFEPINLE